MDDADIAMIARLAGKSPALRYRDGVSYYPVLAVQVDHKDHEDDVPEPVAWLGGGFAGCVSLWASDPAAFVLLQANPLFPRG